MKYLRLLRPKQWYKNLLLFLAIIFVIKITDFSALLKTILAFVSFCALSSATYIINDIADKDKDKLHPEKSNRPIASGEIGILEAVLLLLLILAIGLGIAIFLPIEFLYAALGYFALSQIYTACLKHEPFIDILTIAVNFVIRAVAGALAISVKVSPWLIIGIFFLALFLMLGKRKSELMLLGKNAQLQRRTLKAYTPEIVSMLNAMATTALVMAYTLFVFFGQHKGLYITLPVALYAIFRYENLISSGSKIARHPEYVFTDVRMMITMLIWGVLTLGILYF